MEGTKANPVAAPGSPGVKGSPPLRPRHRQVWSVSENALVLGKRIYFAERLDYMGPRLAMSSVDLIDGSFRSVPLKNASGVRFDRGSDDSAIDTACLTLPQGGSKLYTCDNAGSIWEFDPIKATMRATGEVSPRIVKAPYIDATASQSSAGADRELTILAETGGPGELVLERYRLRDAKLLESRPIKSLRPMLKSRKFYVDNIAVISL